MEIGTHDAEDQILYRYTSDACPLEFRAMRNCVFLNEIHPKLSMKFLI